jgi:hypothetical protein
MSNLLFMVFPDFETYKTAPQDMSDCIIDKCQNCGKDCWMSEYKKSLMKQAKEQNQDCFSACYGCFRDSLENNPQAAKAFLEQSQFVKI